MVHSISIRSYFRYCRVLLMDPAAFFREEFHRISISSALTFGLASAWISAVLAFFAHSFTTLAIQRIFRNWLDDFADVGEVLSTANEEARSFLFQSGTVIVYPFIMLWYVAAISGMLFLFSRIFIQDQANVSYRNCLKILALSLVSSWLILVPVFGGVIAYAAFVILAIIGIREIFWVTTQRAALVVLTPQVFFLAFITMVLGVVALFAVAWLSMMFSGGGADL